MDEREFLQNIYPFYLLGKKLNNILVNNPFKRMITILCHLKNFFLIWKFKSRIKSKVSELFYEESFWETKCLWDISLKSIVFPNSDSCLTIQCWRYSQHILSPTNRAVWYLSTVDTPLILESICILICIYIYLL